MINKDPIRRPKLKELLKRPIFNMNNLNPDELLRDDKLVLRLNFNGLRNDVFFTIPP